jgi:hypothetical protein
MKFLALCYAFLLTTYNPSLPCSFIGVIGYLGWLKSKVGMSIGYNQCAYNIIDMLLLHLFFKFTIGFVGPTCGSYSFNVGFEKNMDGDGREMEK